VEKVLADVIDGYISIAAAKETYAVVVDPQSLTVNAAATSRLRGV